MQTDAPPEYDPSDPPLSVPVVQRVRAGPGTSGSARPPPPQYPTREPVAPLPGTEVHPNLCRVQIQTPAWSPGPRHPPAFPQFQVLPDWEEPKDRNPRDRAAGPDSARSSHRYWRPVPEWYWSRGGYPHPGSRECRSPEPPIPSVCRPPPAPDPGSFLPSCWHRRPAARRWEPRSRTPLHPGEESYGRSTPTHR